MKPQGSVPLPIPERPSPAGLGKPVRPCGKPAVGAPTLFLSKALLDEVVEYAGGDKHRPRGGFLLGHRAQWKGDHYLEMVAHVPAEQGIGKGNVFQFTQKSFENLEAQSQALWPTTNLLGWYYTHLNTGIFLSGSDLQLHRQFFSQWWMCALVLDPIQGTLSFFQWQGKQLAPSGFILT